MIVHLPRANGTWKKNLSSRCPSHVYITCMYFDNLSRACLDRGLVDYDTAIQSAFRTNIFKFVCLRHTKRVGGSEITSYWNNENWNKILWRSIFRFEHEFNLKLMKLVFSYILRVSGFERFEYRKITSHWSNKKWNKILWRPTLDWNNEMINSRFNLNLI